MRVVIIEGCTNPGLHPACDPAELPSPYADLQPDMITSEVDWYANDFDSIAEQTLSGGRAD